MIKVYKYLSNRHISTCLFTNQSHTRNSDNVKKMFVQYYSFNSQQRSNLARKFLQKEIIFKQNFENENSLKKNVPTSSNPYRKKKPPPDISRRLIKLDKVFLEKITDLLSTAEYATEILENRIEITKAQVQIGFSAIHIFWTSPDSKLDEKINSIFIKIAPLLRLELKQLNVFGRVPPLTFIKDITHDLMADIDKRLALADFGTDYEPTNAAYHIITENILHKQLNEEVWNALNEKSKEIIAVEVGLLEEENLPEIGNCIFGLPRDRIISVVMKEMKSSTGEHRKSKEESDMEHQRSFVSPTIIKSSSFMQVDGARASSIRQWAKEFNSKKRKLMKGTPSVNEEGLDFEENETENYNYSKDMVDEDFDEQFVDDYESSFRES